MTVPGEFLNPNAKPLSCHSDPFNSLIKRLVPTPTSQHGLSTPTTPHCLENASFVFIRRDCHRGPLQRPYDGPYRVITPGPKTFRVKVGLREEVISVDRLKPAHVDLTQPVSVAQPRQRGRPPTQAKQEKPYDCQTPVCTSSTRATDVTFRTAHSSPFAFPVAFWDVSTGGGSCVAPTLLCSPGRPC